jgi:hypothetical protein
MESIPLEIQTEILFYCAPNDVYNFLSVNKCSSKIRSVQHFWEEYICKKYPANNYGLKTWKLKGLVKHKNIIHGSPISTWYGLFRKLYRAKLYKSMVFFRDTYVRNYYILISQVDTISNISDLLNDCISNILGNNINDWTFQLSNLESCKRIIFKKRITGICNNRSIFYSHNIMECDWYPGERLHLLTCKSLGKQVSVLDILDYSEIICD